MTQELKNNQGQNDQIFANKGSFEIVFDTGLQRFLFGFTTKVEKLSIATELLTNLFETHPLGIKLTASILNIHESCFSLLRETPQRPVLIGLESLLILVLEYRSLLQIGRHGGLISSMNGDLMQREITLLVYELEKEITSRKGTPAGYGGSNDSVPLSREFLASNLFDETRVAKHIEFKKPGSESRPITAPVYQGHSNVPYVSKDKYIKDTRQTTKTPVVSSGTFSKPQNLIPEKSERRSEILKVLKFNGPSDIRYIQSMVPGVGEKTIQRELNAMIGEGSILRKGIKRWSTYELASGT